MALGMRTANNANRAQPVGSSLDNEYFFVCGNGVVGAFTNRRWKLNRIHFVDSFGIDPPDLGLSQDVGTARFREFLNFIQ